MINTCLWKKEKKKKEKKKKVKTNKQKNPLKKSLISFAVNFNLRCAWFGLINRLNTNTRYVTIAIACRTTNWPESYFYLHGGPPYKTYVKAKLTQHAIGWWATDIWGSCKSSEWIPAERAWKWMVWNLKSWLQLSRLDRLDGLVLKIAWLNGESLIWCIVWSNVLFCFCFSSVCFSSVFFSCVIKCFQFTE